MTLMAPECQTTDLAWSPSPHHQAPRWEGGKREREREWMVWGGVGVLQTSMHHLSIPTFQPTDKWHPDKQPGSSEVTVNTAGISASKTLVVVLFCSSRLL